MLILELLEQGYIVIDDKLAVRVQDSMDSDNVVRYFFEEHMI